MATLDVYSKQQSDSLLGTKADSASVYTKASVDSLLSNKADVSALNAKADVTALNSGLATKQDTLVSGTNIKTINGTSILGSGNISIQGSGNKIITLKITNNNGITKTEISQALINAGITDITEVMSLTAGGYTADGKYHCNMVITGYAGYTSLSELMWSGPGIYYNIPSSGNATIFTASHFGYGEVIQQYGGVSDKLVIVTVNGSTYTAHIIKTIYLTLIVE